MFDWLIELGTLAVLYFWIAGAATLFLIVQIVLMLFSFGGADTDLDGDADLDFDTGTGVDVFTIKGMTAFFALGGWVGLLCVTLFPQDLVWLSVFPALFVGGLAMLGLAFLMKAMSKLQQSGNIDKKNIVGKTATVYVTVLPNFSGRGKVTMILQGQYTELDAVTDGDVPLYNGEQVLITSYQNATACVRKVGS